MTSESKPLLLIQAGTPPEALRSQEGDLSDWFQAALGVPEDQINVVRVFEGEPLPEPCADQPAVITGSWAMVTDELDWSEATADWIRRAMAIQQPLFGVCYGHQLMAHAQGGTVDYHPMGIEIGCLPVHLLPGGTQDALVSNLPPHFDAHLTHMQSVLVPPSEAVVLARSAHDPHQILRYGPHAISTQFHPEFTPRIMEACVNSRAEFLQTRGLDTAAIKARSRDTVFTRALLQRFVQTYLGRALAAACRLDTPSLSL